jgi:hypothetical protein
MNYDLSRLKTKDTKNLTSMKVDLKEKAETTELMLTREINVPPTVPSFETDNIIVKYEVKVSAGLD